MRRGQPGERRRQPHQAGLGDGVLRGGVGAGVAPGARRDVHDRSAARVGHRPQQPLRQGHRNDEVEVEDRAPLVGGGVRELPARRPPAAGVVRPAAPAARARPPRPPPCRRPLGATGPSPPARIRAGRRCAPRRVGVDVDDHDHGAAVGEPGGHDGPEPAARAGHHRHTSREVHAATLGRPADRTCVEVGVASPRVASVEVHQLSRTEARRLAVQAQLLAMPAPGRPARGRERPDAAAERPRGGRGPQRRPRGVEPAGLVVRTGRGGRGARGAVAGRAGGHASCRPRTCGSTATTWRSGRAAGPLTPWRHANAEWVRANEACRRDILERLRADGPLTSRELPDTCVVPWRSTRVEQRQERAAAAEAAWSSAARSPWPAARAATGSGTWRADLPRRAGRPLPPRPPRTRDERRLHVARHRPRPAPPRRRRRSRTPSAMPVSRRWSRAWGTWRVDPALLGRPFPGRAALLSPLDRLVHDRKRMTELFEFDYQLEMYKPAAERRWGYWALPVLYGDRLVGKLDATADRDRRAAAGRRAARGRAVHPGDEHRRAARDHRPGPVAGPRPGDARRHPDDPAASLIRHPGQHGWAGSGCTPAGLNCSRTCSSRGSRNATPSTRDHCVGTRR